MQMKQMQARVLQNKIQKNFNITNIDLEFCLLYGEIAEAHTAYRNNDANLGEELADVAIYLLGIAEILGIDLEKEIERKMKINERRVYRQINGKWEKFLLPPDAEDTD